AYQIRGFVRAQAGDLEGAIVDLRHFCELKEDAQDYPRLFLFVFRSQLGETDAARTELADYLKDRWTKDPKEWVGVIGDFLISKIEEKELFSAVHSNDSKVERSRRCEASYFAGIIHLLDGDKKNAADYFRKCIATEMSNFSEFRLARVELKRLEK
ncbi:MAG: hypothetical protein AAF585_14245, partial [Verrucomicrobiota bacterium]